MTNAWLFRRGSLLFMRIDIPNTTKGQIVLQLYNGLFSWVIGDVVRLNPLAIKDKFWFFRKLGSRRLFLTYCKPEKNEKGDFSIIAERIFHSDGFITSTVEINDDNLFPEVTYEKSPMCLKDFLKIYPIEYD